MKVIFATPQGDIGALLTEAPARGDTVSITLHSFGPIAGDPHVGTYRVADREWRMQTFGPGGGDAIPDEPTVRIVLEELDA